MVNSLGDLLWLIIVIVLIVGLFIKLFREDD